MEEECLCSGSLKLPVVEALRLSVSLWDSKYRRDWIKAVQNCADYNSHWTLSTETLKMASGRTNDCSCYVPYIGTHKNKHNHKHKHTHTRMHTYTHTDTQTHTHTHSCTHTYTHTHTHTLRVLTHFLLKCIWFVLFSLESETLSYVYCAAFSFVFFCLSLNEVKIKHEMQISSTDQN